MQMLPIVSALVAVVIAAIIVLWMAGQASVGAQASLPEPNPDQRDELR